MQTATASARAYLAALFDTALAAVDGGACVRRFLSTHPQPCPVAVAAIGKAAPAMLQGALEALGDCVEQALLVQPGDYPPPALAFDPALKYLPGDHPVPGPRSLAAGRHLLEFIAALPAQRPLLLLLSGGTSSLVEVPAQGVDLALLQRAGDWLLGSGLDIAQVNRVRRRLSSIKGGQLVERLGTRAAEVLLLSDVPGDDPAVVGSGLLRAPAQGGVPDGLPDWLAAAVERHVPRPARSIPHHVVGSNHDAASAILARAAADGYPVAGTIGELSGDVTVAARCLARHVQSASAGIHVWGGETTVSLPRAPGTGGRNQQLAALLARELAGDGTFTLLAAGTDGRDGNSAAAGAIVDGQTVRRGAAAGWSIDDCLARADAGSFLAASGDLLVTGPTTTNVMDIVILLKTS